MVALSGYAFLVADLVCVWSVTLMLQVFRWIPLTEACAVMKYKSNSPVTMFTRLSINFRSVCRNTLSSTWYNKSSPIAAYLCTQQSSAFLLGTAISNFWELQSQSFSQFKESFCGRLINKVFLSSFQPQTLQLDFLMKILPNYHHLKKTIKAGHNAS